jgi:TonB family protein
LKEEGFGVRRALILRSISAGLAVSLCMWLPTPTTAQAWLGWVTAPDGTPIRSEWTQLPSPEDVKAVAGSIAPGTVAAFDCIVDAEGKLTQCKALGERPKGAGANWAVDRASLATLLSGLRLMKTTGAGASTENYRVRVVIRPDPSGYLLPPSVITTPDWVKKPDASTFARLYPGRASVAGVQGRVVVDCEVEVDGTLGDCQVLSEDPPGWGFGDATIKAAKSFRMRPQTRDGAPQGGARTKIPINWRLG